jgi:hypothetical protein
MPPSMGGVRSGIYRQTTKRTTMNLNTFSLFSSPVYIGPGAVSGTWVCDFNGNAFPSVVTMLPQPFWPESSLGPTLVASPVGVAQRAGGGYQFSTNVTNAPGNESQSFNIQCSAISN